MLILILLLCALVLFLLWRNWPRKWQRLPQYYSEASYTTSLDVDKRRLTEALQAAETAIIRHGKRWNAGQVASVCFTMRLRISRSNDLAHLSGVSHKTHIVQVGPRLEALAHELIHLCEKCLEYEVDLAHEAWERDGLWNAVRSYEIWLIEKNIHTYWRKQNDLSRKT